MTKAVQIKGVSKKYGSYQAIKKVSFDIHDNEFFTLLGPSGCGKTTLLRMIAGFETPTTGNIILHGQNIENLPANKRRVNTVFQNYALFPHMNLEENIGFGLEMLGWKKDKRECRVNEMLKLVHMEQFAKRFPSELSGGQQQRIALARALAPEPEVLLLDEPLSALDLKLRQAMREELQDLQRQTGITFIFVTHDQEEALAMSDRICVLAHGEIQHLDSPINIYENPTNRFVADFIGDTNFLDVNVTGSNVHATSIETPLGINIDVPASGVKVGQDAVMSLRPEKISINKSVDGVSLPGRVMHRTYMGGYTHYTIQLSSGADLRVSMRNNISNNINYDLNEAVTLGFSPASVRVLGE
ncbi:ABC transporter ATP-binding protein [Neptunomonas qingdaonensis]|uniref:Spermidine/putrescine import ATP-binding protein PotA n=1 Tax=Neptunomonas qingdaonensis TaxID=1045558 RepID=A0A1I2V1R0_9GAMM|nr:ABC transporter ATP-binding protein [Neptunomonas qingdaonensis]SFG83152.1 spermidine/putrescine transport system ATP-binding protein [Neptunomonas qingdaonensis]